MNTDVLKGKWKQMSGSAQKKWGKLTDDELQQIDGEKERLIGTVQEKYGLARDEAEKQVDEWFSEHDTN
ncbi:CsbD family protein [Puniceicoccus vermicola]|uniref:CsbD family protein n=1 Tax=Puniceicoccus vermicola TaxID=388746 RepID=A0A7X1B1F1_9BACT|nr:CsbD family protein [Puniceicoccus vermicola]MBC2603866.1 CsbD family protein [Puniceicoccus vermicola]